MRDLEPEDLGMQTTPLKQVCPHCGFAADMCSAMPGSRGVPRPGACTMCAECGRFSMIAADMTLRFPTDAEAATIAAQPDARLLASTWDRTVGASKRGELIDGSFRWAR